MKVCKPLKLPLLTRVVEFRRVPRLHFGAVLAFPLTSPRALLEEINFWPAVNDQIGQVTFDDGITKAKGEVLAAGKFFAPGGKPTTVSFAAIHVGDLFKRVAVIGDRHWKRGAPTEPAPMVEMPIDWARAFGGKDYGQNPYGVGVGEVERGGEKIVPLPNIERPGALIRSPGDRPAPEGFLPMDWQFAQRRARAGTFGMDYVDKWAPGLPPDHQPTVYNTAREDQWRDAPWVGNEKFVIENMNAEHARIEGALPGLVARVFVTQRTADGDRFHEVDLKCDTVWLLPGANMGAVIFHGSILVADDDAADVVNLIACCEEPSRPRSIDHYKAALERRLDRREGAIADLSDRDIMPDLDSGVAPNMEWGPFAQWVRSDYLHLKKARKGEEAERERQRQELLAEGLDPAQFGLDGELPPLDLPPPEDDVDALAAYLVSSMKKLEDEEARGLEATKKVAAEREKLVSEGEAPGTPEGEVVGGPPVSAETELDRYQQQADWLRSAGTPNLELEAKLGDPAFREQLSRLAEGQRANYAGSAHLGPPAAPMTEEANQLTRVVLVAARDAGESLAERDFTGADLRKADLSRLDLRRAFLEGADLREADLRETILEGAVLARADLRGARLEGARLAGANLGRAKLEGASLESADLTQAVLMYAEIGGCNLADANLSQADVLEAKWGGADLRRAQLELGTFLKADLTKVDFRGARLTQATFIECTLDGVDFSEATLTKSTLVTCKGTGVAFVRARANEMVACHEIELRDADFQDADLERSCLRTTIMPGAKLERAKLMMADLSQCNLRGASLDRVIANQAMFVRANLEGASLRGANLTEALLGKSLLAGADFTGAQLTRADFMRARGDTKTRFTDAVVKWARFDKEGTTTPQPRGGT